jgi:hypothetical protein
VTYLLKGLFDRACRLQCNGSVAHNTLVVVFVHFVMQVTYLLKGLFGRACRSLGGVTEPIDAIREECGQLRGLLANKLVQINTNLEGEC